MTAAPTHAATDGLMVIGDAARQVDPLTGHGIINAVTAGKLMSETAALAIAAGEASSTGRLAGYAEAWHPTVGRKMRRNDPLRGSFPPTGAQINDSCRYSRERLPSERVLQAALEFVAENAAS